MNIKKSIQKIITLYASLFFVLFTALYLMMPFCFDLPSFINDNALGTIMLFVSLYVINKKSKKASKTNDDCDSIYNICKNVPLHIYSISVLISVILIFINKKNTIISLISIFAWNVFYVFSQKHFKDILNYSEENYRDKTLSLTNLNNYAKDLPLSINLLIEVIPLFIINSQLGLFTKDFNLGMSIYTISLFLISILAILYISIDLYKSIKSVSKNNSSNLLYNNEIGTLAYNINTNINKLKSTQQEQLKREKLQAIEIIRRTVDAKDSYTRGHSDRVSKYSVLIGQSLGLNNSDIELLRIGGLFHDIGKIGIPDRVLLKEGKLTDEEYDEIKKHPSIGAHIIENSEVFDELIPIVLHHHEKFDGTGYPDRLKGNDIPRLARIVAVADTFDAMTSKRSYRDPLPLEVVINEIKRCSGSQFDPYVAEVFLNILENNYDKIEEIKKL